MKSLNLSNKMILYALVCGASLLISPIMGSDFTLRQCEPIRIEMCRNIGYNETAMPNLVGNELQNEVEYTLQTFTPLIEYVCSSQLKLFLCATYVPMCTPKVAVPIGPCRSLCESVRSHCHPVLQGFGYPWPPALDCSRFPKENNQDSMCMEGPGEMHDSSHRETFDDLPAEKLPTQLYNLECPSFSKLYVKLHRSGRCAPLCNADILFTENEKHLAEMWTHMWTYAALGIYLLTILCLISGGGGYHTKNPDASNAENLGSLMWCHFMVAIGWTIRFMFGRTATACGFDPQLPNVSLLLVDGLSNIVCASNFFLRYYFGMASCAWWAILCLGWHRGVRRNNPDSLGHINLGTIYAVSNTTKTNRKAHYNKLDTNITSSHLVRFLAWGLPAFQTVAVIVTRLVDADELLGACFVGNQSDRGLQIFVATPLFCYWIFGAMNLSSGFLVYRRNKDLLHTINSSTQPHVHISGLFLLIYCLPGGLLLLAVIYEFAKIDDWLNLSPYISGENRIAAEHIDAGNTPIWPFLIRIFIELMLGVICSAWILGPKLLRLYKKQFNLLPKKPPNAAVTAVHISPLKVVPSAQKTSRSCNKAQSIVSYQSVQPSNRPSSLGRNKKETDTPSTAISMHNITNYSLPTSKYSNNYHTLKTSFNSPSRRSAHTLQFSQSNGNEITL